MELLVWFVVCQSFARFIGKEIIMLSLDITIYENLPVFFVVCHSFAWFISKEIIWLLLENLFMEISLYCLSFAIRLLDSYVKKQCYYPWKMLSWNLPLLFVICHLSARCIGKETTLLSWTLFTCNGSIPQLCVICCSLARSRIKA